MQMLIGILYHEWASHRLARTHTIRGEGLYFSGDSQSHPYNACDYSGNLNHSAVILITYLELRRRVWSVFCQ